MRDGDFPAYAALMASTAIPASAETLRWARAGDSLTLDPHAQNEGPTHTLAHQIYEPLILRDMTGAFQAALATDWAPKETGLSPSLLGVNSTARMSEVAVSIARWTLRHWRRP